MGFDGWGKDVEGVHGAVVTVEVILHHFHGFELLDACFLCDLVLAFVGVVLKVAHIGDVADVAHFVAEMGEVAV